MIDEYDEIQMDAAKCAHEMQEVFVKYIIKNNLERNFKFSMMSLSSLIAGVTYALVKKDRPDKMKELLAEIVKNGSLILDSKILIKKYENEKH